MRSKTIYLVVPPGKLGHGVEPGEFPAGPYAVVKERSEHYTISNGVREIELHMDRFSFVTQPVVYLHEYMATEIIVVITKHRHGFAVTCKDVELDMWLPHITIHPTQQGAIDKANKIVDSYK